MGNESLPADVVALHNKAIAKQNAASEVGALPLPGPLRDTFPEQSTQVSEFTVRPMVASDWAVLQKIDSAIIAQAMQGAKPEAERKEIPITFEDMICACYIFTREPRIAWNDLAKGGKAKLVENAVNEIGAKVDVTMLSAMFAAAQGNTQRTFSTAVSYEAEKQPEDKGGKQVFFPASSQ